MCFFAQPGSHIQLISPKTFRPRSHRVPMESTFAQHIPDISWFSADSRHLLFVFFSLMMIAEVHDTGAMLNMRRNMVHKLNKTVDSERICLYQIGLVGNKER